MRQEQQKQINEQLNKMHTIGLEQFANGDADLAARIHSIMIDLEMAVFSEPEEPTNKLSMEQLEEYVMNCCPETQFYVRQGVLFSDNEEGSNPNPIGDITDLSLMEIEDLLGK